jgi:hypothetical protein
MTVFLMTIRESLPPTEKTPLIGEFNEYSSRELLTVVYYTSVS